MMSPMKNGIIPISMSLRALFSTARVKGMLLITLSEKYTNGITQSNAKASPQPGMMLMRASR